MDPKTLTETEVLESLNKLRTDTEIPRGLKLLKTASLLVDHVLAVDNVKAAADDPERTRAVLQELEAKGSTVNTDAMFVAICFAAIHQSLPDELADRLERAHAAAVVKFASVDDQYEKVRALLEAGIDDAVLTLLDSPSTGASQTPDQRTRIDAARQILGSDCDQPPKSLPDEQTVPRSMPTSRSAGQDNNEPEAAPPVTPTEPPPAQTASPAAADSQPAKKRGRPNKALSTSPSSPDPAPDPGDTGPTANPAELEVSSAVPPPAAEKAEDTGMVPIEQIIVDGGRRVLGKLEGLKDSIGCQGLLQPILVTKDYRLVAGHHRLAACRELGWTKIPVRFLDGDDLHLELAQIDENLVRNELTILERSEHLLRRKQIYVALHPETKAGGAPGKAGGGKVATSKTATVASFASNTAALSSSSERTVQEDVQIATRLSHEVRDAIRDLPIADRKRELLNLARLTPEQQIDVVHHLQADKAASFKEALAAVCGDSSMPRPAKKDDEPELWQFSDTCEAPEMLEALWADSELTHLKKLQDTGELVVNNLFGGDALRAIQAVLPDCGQIRPLFERTDCTDQEITSGVLLYVTGKHVPDDIWAEFLNDKSGTIDRNSGNPSVSFGIENSSTTQNDQTTTRNIRSSMTLPIPTTVRRLSEKSSR